MGEHPQTTAWLLEERERHLRYGRHERVTLVDAELAKRGHRVNRRKSEPAEEYAPEPETAELEPPPEDTAEPRPRRRGRPRRPRDADGNIIRDDEGTATDG